ncbi:MAG: T9SS type A sorting domain-containing protein, partial [Anaerolineales bacterium]|nr:T9SS type A sorting domain-containing protein [Anaerolineales bacterium]
DADGEVEYAIEYGNNLISYPFENGQGLEAGLGDNVASVYAIAGEGVAALAINGSFVGSLTAFEGGNGYWLVATDDFSFSFAGVSAGLTRAKSVPVQLMEDFMARKSTMPSEYSYAQSQEQAFFFVQNATIRGEALEYDDIVIAYNDDVVVGSQFWNGEMTDVPAIGVDPKDSDKLAGYAEEDDKISFKVFDASTGELVTMDAEGDIEWTSKLTMPVINLTDTFLPTEVSLSNAYPNPFNPVTMLTYDVPSDMVVSMGIYDVRGRLVHELVNDMREQGRYEVTWNADQHSSGVYMVKMTAGNAVKVQKVMLVK